jgi:hypothetical protein
VDLENLDQARRCESAFLVAAAFPRIRMLAAATPVITPQTEEEVKPLWPRCGRACVVLAERFRREAIGARRCALDSDPVLLERCVVRID